VSGKHWGEGVSRAGEEEEGVGRALGVSESEYGEHMEGGGEKRRGGGRDKESFGCV